VASCACVMPMGNEFTGRAYIDHWLRVFAPPDDCDGATAGELVPNKADCHNFYVCLGDGEISPTSFPCGDDYECFYPAVGGCTTDATECEAVCAGGGGGEGCATECPDPVTVTTIVASSDCTKFKLCFAPPSAAPYSWYDQSTRGEVEISCPSDTPFFNGAECGTDKAACCSCQIGTCVYETERLPDPNDCHSYLQCVDADGDGTVDPDPVGPIPCENGGSFDGTACTANTNCENACDAGATTPAATTSVPFTTPVDTTSTTPHYTTSVPLTTPADTTSDAVTTETATIGTTTTFDGCIDLSHYTCPALWHYARCPYCDPSYIICDSMTMEPRYGWCPDDLAFNPNPDYPYCIPSGNCPFNP
ncbi:unnamed protein product, partial [Meganyctiphanes norvegica]